MAGVQLCALAMFVLKYFLMKAGGDMPKGYKHLTYNDRLKIDLMIRHGHSVGEIAAEIGCSLNTIYNELKRGRYMHRNSDLTEEERYNPDGSEERYRRLKREKGRGLKIGNDMKFVNFVEDMILNHKYSPAAVLMKIEQENLQFDTKICLSTLYNYIRQGVFLHVELKECPVPRHKRKKKVLGTPKQKRVSRGTSIEKRPEEVNERNTVGHWEMDTVVGPQGKSHKCLLVLSERKLRYEIIEILDSKTSAEVIRALDRIERRLGEKRFRELFKSITVDNGPEFNDFEGIERSRRNRKNRTKVYYCHPYSFYERGLNENQNLFIRRFIPKGMNFDDLTNKEVKEIERWINTYPRKLFEGKSAQQLYEEFQAREQERGRAPVTQMNVGGYAA